MPIPREILREVLMEAVSRFITEKRSARRGQVKGHTIEWNEDIKAKFMEWLRLENKAERYIKECVRNLDRYMRPISSPADVIAMFSECRGGRQHLDRAFRNLLKFYRKMGFPKSLIEDLKEAIPTIKTGVDTYVPTEENVVSTLRALRTAPLKYRVLYWTVLSSCLRVEDAIKFINEADLEAGERVETPEGTSYMWDLKWIRAKKAAFVAFLPDFIYEMLKEWRKGGEKLTPPALWAFTRRRKGIERPNSMRDFGYNKLLLLGVPESVADFINGRGPRTIGAKHYMDRVMQAKAFYPRYYTYLRQLRAKVEK